jgi:iron complex outermembrane receptor protein
MLQTNGYATTYFPEDDPILDPTGLAMQKRNRLSYAILNQVSGEYNGRFMDRLTVNLGLRSPWFKRDLNNYCVTEAGGTFVDCFNDPTSQALFLAANPTYTPPTRRVFKFHKLLPTVGVSYDLAQRTTLFASYNKGIQVPGTDNLYQSLGFAPGSATPTPETTDNFEGGVRYTTSRIQAQLSGWYTVFNNRLASSYDPSLDVTVYRNLGTVHKYGIDADIAYRPIPPVTLYAFASILKSKILDNVESGKCTAAQVTAGASTGTGTCTTVGQPIYYLTAGRREGGSPTSLLGARAEYNGSMFEVGAQAKYTGPRYVNDQNLPILQSYTRNGATTFYQVYGAKAPGYTLVDLDARIYFTKIAPNKTTYLQLNLTNVFDKLFVAGFTPNTATTSIPFSYVGAPRTFSASLNFEF